MSVSTMRSAEPTKADQSDTAKAGALNNELLRGVRVALDVQLGQASLPVEDVMSLKAGSVVALQTGLADNVGLYLNEKLIARGEIVAVGDRYGVRIVEIAAAP